VFLLNVKIRFYDILKDKVNARYTLDRGWLTLNLEEYATVADLLLLTGLTREEIGLIIINDHQASADSMLRDKDQIQLFSPLSGG
jgi:sulfur carrier protein ThiS